jgi:hypothetical protein
MSFLNRIAGDWTNNNVSDVTANSEGKAEAQKVVNEINAKYPMIALMMDLWNWNKEHFERTLQYILFVDKHS